MYVGLYTYTRTNLHTYVHTCMYNLQQVEFYLYIYAYQNVVDIQCCRCNNKSQWCYDSSDNNLPFYSYIHYDLQVHIHYKFNNYTSI